MHKAALLEKTKGPTPGRTWLKAQFGVDDPDQLTPEQRAAAIRRAQDIVAKAARGKDARATTQPAPVASTPASASAMASAQQIETVQTIAATRGWDPAQLAAQIRNVTGDRRTPRAAEGAVADLTAREAEAFINEFGHGLGSAGRRSA